MDFYLFLKVQLKILVKYSQQRLDHAKQSTTDALETAPK